MVINKIFKDEIVKSMEQANLIPITNLHIGWNDEKKILVVVEKREKSSGIIYEVHAMRLFLVGDRMQKIFASKTTSNIQTLRNVLDAATQKGSLRKAEGVLVRDPHTAINMLFTTHEAEKPQRITQTPPSPPARMHVYGGVIGYVCNLDPYDIENPIEVTDTPILLSEGILTDHILITGMTDSGKTVIAKNIAMEVRKMGKPVLVVTPEPQDWKSIGKNYMINDNDTENEFYIEEDTINIFSTLNVKDRGEEITRVLDSIVEEYSGMSQTTGLRLLFVVDEAHKLLKNPEHCSILDSAIRQLRKVGVGCVFISQSFYDFETRGVRGNAHTHITLRTIWEKDRQQIKRATSSKELSEMASTFNDGYGIFMSVSKKMGSMMGQPVVCRFLGHGETIQPSSLQPSATRPSVGLGVSTDDSHHRRLAILDIVKDNPRITADTVQSELERKGIIVNSSTISRDLDRLEKKNRVMVAGVGERNKKYYKIVE